MSLLCVFIQNLEGRNALFFFDRGKSIQLIALGSGKCPFHALLQLVDIQGAAGAHYNIGSGVILPLEI